MRARFYNPVIYYDPSGYAKNTCITKARSFEERVAKSSGLKYRSRVGSNGELRSAFAKIESKHIGKGTNTNKSARTLMQKLGLATDDAGHAIGKNLGGPVGARSKNLFQQNLNINRGNFAQFEKMIAKEVLKGKEVFIRVVPRSMKGATRPYEVL
ncbi:DNA/RNA non-specific endonuclease [Clostridium estertheticum]|uniref:Type VII secretion system protein EssD-like domain-containing protein n=1 Tax=Clostridium estertheticum subsp. estertheticum TaxID=1552 RepID=A0A1J0GG27_9CLOT|nr:DNA/RNA non-specific endonuclease [Clostridium estertheticum]APC40324.1 hypothetical protein A7L45_09735 [Clostridium estertheticum subsp. estertheticum]MBZ9617859.1 DNA/RNA non-specific endonuclease [Clostridium estertheticum subsp. laramiense]WAG73523.1 DNA/RNA non-specific endonuclease [Clostridium estertheticum]